ncbi:PEGA domain-containing protein [Stieleria marina]|uniref:PEGA domain-containing protein n=1 Tax=Stieleria marina TaxID=1930275 RepID=UPI003AF362B0
MSTSTILVRASSCTLALLILCNVGCVRRRMMVRTNPPGATVSVDNQVIGTSPAASSFTYYGTREMRIDKEGFRTETIRRKFNPPWYQWPGLDFVSETLWPGEIRDERIIDVQLVPKEFEPSENVVRRADALRNQAQTGVVTGPRK